MSKMKCHWFLKSKTKKDLRKKSQQRACPKMKKFVYFQFRKQRLLLFWEFLTCIIISGVFLKKRRKLICFCYFQSCYNSRGLVVSKWIKWTYVYHLSRIVIFCKIIIINYHKIMVKFCPPPSRWRIFNVVCFGYILEWLRDLITTQCNDNIINQIKKKERSVRFWEW